MANAELRGIPRYSPVPMVGECSSEYKRNEKHVGYKGDLSILAGRFEASGASQESHAVFVRKDGTCCGHVQETSSD